MPSTYDIAIIGGGIVGLATAMALTREKHPSLIVLEAENRLAAHQTGNNSGVIHSGIYYKPGSLKAQNCVKGREAMYAFCAEHQIAHDRCGKVIVATSESELPALDRLYERGLQNGLNGLRRLKGEEIKEYEPYAAGIAAIFVPQTGIVDYVGVCQAYASLIQQAGGEIKTNARVTGFRKAGNEFVLTTPQGEIATRNLINCGGLQSDRIARLCGVDPGLKIVPFRGEYYELIPEKHHLVRNLIYPVPDPRFPFLGVHFTRMVKGGIEAGPNAVLAFKREGYKMSDISLRDMFEYALYGGFWKMAAKYWKTAVGEYYRSLSKAAFVKALQRLLPDLTADDIHRSGAGVRAQALDPQGNLVDDFRIVEAARMVHVLNAPSPAATASIAIGESIAAMAAKNFNL
ncbi:MAG TPA: L-2-hydroxyglutarate oxidase [Anaerolinea thermolimosa]|uniref:L-2-hydroxyglutarate oxidase n=1 Tax=Anaerolinea thermolimosa TaxID=229919 RepID=A0A3D1JES9_9CHLR|nr:L-2-hydroxyglutarate oxidase [Anaerolinea thermolimosa]GAP06199.1 predicted dehydrogenase [Anaerolinea thermolimosa]HCE16747.1 L-2-hydroxyglutarate oxidase [Anaerolinea thermolimosa]